MRLLLLLKVWSAFFAPKRNDRRALDVPNTARGEINKFRHGEARSFRK